MCEKYASAICVFSCRNQRVKLHSEDEVVIVKGLDASGFLLVESKSGSFVSLQPDGNSFDMMQGLISVKTRK